jgi:large subunit ribosomal protein L18
MRSNILKRKLRNRSGLKHSDRPRLSIYRSNSHISAQVIEPNGKVLASANDVQLNTKQAKPAKGEKMNKTQMAEKVGEMVAVMAIKSKVSEVVFDRGAYKYHGRVKALAEAARKAGLKF